MINYDPTKLYVCVTYTPEFQAMFDHLCETLKHPNIEIHANRAAMLAAYEGFRSPGWFECLKRKMQFFYDFLSALPDGAVVCSIDADIQVFKPDALYALKEQLERCLLECYGQAEHHQRWIEKKNVGVANGGFFMLKKTARVLDCLRSVLAQNYNRRYLGDQEYLNHFMRQRRVQYLLLPPEELLHGAPIVNGEDKFIVPTRLILHHATFAFSVDEKHEQMNKLRELCDLPLVDWERVKNTNENVTHYVAGRSTAQNSAVKPYAVVLARYAEDLSWAEQWQDKLDVFVYNKGAPCVANFNAHWLTLPNVGREAHTYLTHIVQNYDKLHEVTIFLQGRIDDAHAHRPDRLLDYIEPAKRHGFSASHLMLVQPSHWNNIDFLSLPKYAPKVRNGSLRLNKDGLLAYANKFFGRMPVMAVSTYTGCFAASREAILRRPKSFYENLRATVGDHPDPEEAHFLERLWAHMFSGTAHVPYLLKIPADKHDKFLY